MKSASPYTTLGIEIGASVIVGVLAGYWLDTRWGTSPWFAVGGFVVGMVAAGRVVVRAARAAARADEREQAAAREQRKAYLNDRTRK